MNYYQLLSVESTASAPEIKRAFRAEISRYHPDKVQHLGTEFQEMAARRSALLTEAYRTLTHPGLRAEYDRRQTFGPIVSSPAPGAAEPIPSPARAPAATAAGTSRFAADRALRDQFVRAAILERVRQAFAAEFGVLPESGGVFDLEYAVTTKRLLTSTSQRFAVRLVPHAGSTAVRNAWVASLRGTGPVCVLLLASTVAPARELAEIEAVARTNTPTRAHEIIVVPVDVRDWTSRIPPNAPPACRRLLQRLAGS